jgi:glycosyltransferase involved in cell wall biosynthesis
MLDHNGRYMRILFVTASYPPFLDFGGPPRTAEALARELTKAGNAVGVLTVNHDLRRPGFSRWLDGVRVQYLPSIVRYRSSGTIAPGAVPAAHRLVNGADVVHIFGLYDMIGPAAGFAARRDQVPYLVEPMGMYRPILRGLRKKRAYHALLGRRLLSGAARLVATSSLERDELISGGTPPEKIVERSNGLDVSEFAALPERGRLRGRLGIAPDAPVILFLSRLTPKKHPEMVIDVLAGQRDRPAHAVFVGPDEDGTRARLERLAAERGLAERISLTGPLHGPEKLEAFADADVFVLPSENENFGNVVLEALASGLPVVVSDRCGVASAIGPEVGYVVPPRAPEFVEAVWKVLREGGMRRRVAVAGRTIAERYSWDGVAAHMAEIYRTVVTDHSTPII